MNDDIRDFFILIDEIMAKYLVSTTKKTLYHYTSPEALKNIIEKKQLWFSDVHYLNDKSEIEYTRKLILDILANRKDLDPDFHANIDSCIRFNCNSKKVLYYPRPGSQKYYIASFSTAPDELSLWNYYTKNDKKGGYNIGFNAEKFMNLIATERYNGKKIIFGKIMYIKRRQTQLINFILDKFNEKYTNTKDDDKKEILTLRCAGFMNTMSLFFKDSSFSAEKEYRFVFVDYRYKKVKKDINKDYRILNGIFIPYIKLDFTSDIIDSITPSPLIDYKQCSGLCEFLKENGLNIIPSKSSIPLRY